VAEGCLDLGLGFEVLEDKGGKSGSGMVWYGMLVVAVVVIVVLSPGNSCV